MGQNSSNPVSPRAGEKRTQSPPPRPSAPPSKPPTPRTPNYVVPENKVIHNGIADMGKARKLLRPVSQELTKFHPDFADIFQYNPEIPFKPGDDSLSVEQGENVIKDNNKENSSAPLIHSLSSPQLISATDKPGNVANASSSNFSSVNTFSNGDVPKENGHVPSPTNGFESNTLDITQRKPEPASNLRRSHSLERERTQPMKVTRHRRQASLTTGTSLQGAVIPEDPREHLYNVARQEPFSNVMPSTTSLPLKSSFDLDYSFNVTYAQLSEYRRQKRLNELEEKTGRKMEEMSADITASNTVPKSPFDRQNLGGKSGTHSVSTGSSETGVSKSKKKKAPAPPPPPGVAPKRDKSPGNFSLSTEPPADYEMEDISSNNSSLNRQSRSLQRTSSIISRTSHSKSPAPTPLPKSKLGHRQLASISSTPAPPPIGNLGTDTTPLATSIPPAPPLPSHLQQTTPAPAEKTHNVVQKDAKVSSPPQNALQKSMSDARAQIEALKKLEDVLKTPRTSEEKETPKPDEGEAVVDSEEVIAQLNSEINNNSVTESTTDLKDSSASGGNDPVNMIDSKVNLVAKESFTLPTAREESGSKLDASFSSTASDGKLQPKRMSSLLQHDIMLAAQARGSKVVKTKPPPTLEKPKDPAELFREELAKAASAREARRQDAIANGVDKSNQITSKTPGHKKNVPFKSVFQKVSKRNSYDKDKANVGGNSSPLLKEAPGSDKKNIPDKDDHVTKLTVTSNTDANPDNGDFDQEMNAIGANLDFDKRGPIHPESVSLTSSSGGSQRVFSPSWTPEDDLDSDDDIMDESYTLSERNVSTEGFKSSVIPTKLNELKNSKKKKQKKQKKPEVAPKQKSLDDLASAENGDVKSAAGSIRKFKKSVHESMRNAFDSISKASGKLLKKQKSCEFLDISKELLPQQGLSPREERAQVSLNPNWEMSGTHEGSLRRRVSDGSVSVPYENDVDGIDMSEEESDADVGDIDFASGIDAISSPRSLKMSSGAGNMKQLKRAGVAYMSKNGQIVVLPEYETVNVDTEGRVVGESGAAEEGRAPKLYKKKNKKFSYESTVRVQERSRLDESLSNEIKEKEKQIEIERLRQKEIERDFLRLRDLEAQERLQRQITMLQQQQVQQAHASLNNSSTGIMPMDPLRVVPNTGPIQSSFGHSNQMVNSSYMPNGHGSYIGGGAPAHSSSHLAGSTAPLSHQRYSVPPTAFSTTVLGHPISHTSLAATTLDSAPYANHSAPIIGGGGVSSTGTPSAFPNLSSQDVGYLSEYMRMLGVTPPSTQQQWAVLLSTLSINTQPGYTGFESSQGTHHAHSGYNIPNLHGPDLSQIFSGNVGGGKTLESTTMGSKKQVISLITGSQSPVMGRDLSPLQRIPQDGLYYKTLLQTMMEAAAGREGGLQNNYPVQGHNQQNASLPPPPPLPSSHSLSRTATTYNTAAEETTTPPTTTTNRQSHHQPMNTVTDNDTATTVTAERNGFPDDKASSSRDLTNTTTTRITVVNSRKENEGMARISVPDYAGIQQQDERMDYTSEGNDNGNLPAEPANGEVRSGDTAPFGQRAGRPFSGIPAKVYGPLGFRPVSFPARSS
ncbi:uncharacterized protein LOC101847200 [Aplysia californica]|uniref:Uncharacterized protein LOC101847200 n=1 Tax=Aplysia californica TaxID=6500 RepID=A0ABM0JUP6_APLCA|nr:uncharacterized protein LOC101847200 [Aplysia californica]